MKKKADFTKESRHLDSLGLYLKQIYRYSLLSPEQEIEFSKRVQKGDKKAEQELVLSNLRYVVSVARKFQNRGLSLADLIGEGNIDLCKAVKQYDWKKGCRFTTYSVWWIKQSIIHSLLENNLSLTAGSGTRASAYRMQDYIDEGYSLETISSEFNVPISDIRRKVSLNHHLPSLDSPVNGNVTPRGNFVEDTRAYPGDISSIIIKDLLEYSMQELTNREKEIIRFRMGYMEEDLTLKELGEKYSSCPETIRLVQKKAIKKLREKIGVL
jgi:RNA polymerase primary sigma factor